MASGNRRSGKGRCPKPKKKPMKFEKKKRRGNPHSSDREQKMKAFASLEEDLTDDDVGVKECHFCGVPEHLHTECLKCGNMMCGDEDGSICWMCTAECIKCSGSLYDHDYCACGDDVSTQEDCMENYSKCCPDCDDFIDSIGHDYCDHCGEGFCHSSDKERHFCYQMELHDEQMNRFLGVTGCN